MNHDLEDRLRDAFTYRADRTNVRSDSNQSVQRRGEPRRLLPALAAVAAAGVVVVGGLVAVNATRNGSASPTVPLDSLPPANVTHVDVRADELSLDVWIGQASNDAPAASWTVIDVSALPDGLELTSEEGKVLLGLPFDETAPETGSMAATHQYRAELRDGNGTSFSVAVTSNKLGPCTQLIEEMGTPPAPEPSSSDDSGVVAGVDINGIDAAVSGSLVCWMVTPESVASVEMLGASSPGDAEASIELARQLTFTQADRLPQQTWPPESAPGPAAAEFNGTLNGVPWAATVASSSLRSMSTFIDGQPSGAFSNDRLSQPTDAPAGTGEVSLDAVPGKGAIVYGYVSPEVLTVRVTNSNAQSLVLATFQRELESFFAVPIPDGVTIDTLQFLRADGTTYATATIGPLPEDLVGGYGGIFTIIQSPTSND